MEKNQADFCYREGMKYWLGRGVDMDRIAAHKWFNLAALFGDSDAWELRESLVAEMSPVQILTAQRQAREWLSSRSNVSGKPASG